MIPASKSINTLKIIRRKKRIIRTYLDKYIFDLAFFILSFFFSLFSPLIKFFVDLNIFFDKY